MNEDQRLYAEALHDMLERSYSWDKLAGMGVFELGEDPATAVVAFEELGHHAVPGPVVETVVAGSLLPLGGRSATIATPHTEYALDADDADLDGGWIRGYQFALAGPIYAGTNEIQRNVIAERLLGLPR